MGSGGDGGGGSVCLWKSLEEIRMIDCVLPYFVVAFARIGALLHFEKSLFHIVLLGVIVELPLYCMQDSLSALCIQMRSRDKYANMCLGRCVC